MKERRNGRFTFTLERDRQLLQAVEQCDPYSVGGMAATQRWEKVASVFEGGTVTGAIAQRRMRYLLGKLGYRRDDKKNGMDHVVAGDGEGQLDKNKDDHDHAQTPDKAINPHDLDEILHRIASRQVTQPHHQQQRKQQEQKQQQRTRYSLAQRIQTVRLAETVGVAKAARECGISKSLVSRWAKHIDVSNVAAFAMTAKRLSKPSTKPTTTNPGSTDTTAAKTTSTPAAKRALFEAEESRLRDWILSQSNYPPTLRGIRLEMLRLVSKHSRARVFKATSAWVYAFFKRSGLTLGVHSRGRISGVEFDCSARSFHDGPSSHACQEPTEQSNPQMSYRDEAVHWGYQEEDLANAESLLRFQEDTVLHRDASHETAASVELQREDVFVDIESDTERESETDDDAEFSEDIHDQTADSLDASQDEPVCTLQLRENSMEPVGIEDRFAFRESTPSSPTLDTLRPLGLLEGSLFH